MVARCRSGFKALLDRELNASFETIASRSLRMRLVGGVIEQATAGLILRDWPEGAIVSKDV